MDDPTFEAYKILHARHYKAMMDDQYMYLPFYRSTSSWAILLEPKHYEDQTTKVLINFANELLIHNECLEDELKAQRQATT